MPLTNLQLRSHDGLRLVANRCGPADAHASKP